MKDARAHVLRIAPFAILLGLLAFSLCSVGCSGNGRPGNGSLDPLLEALRENVDTARIERVIAHLSSQEAEGRPTGAPVMEEVRSFLVERMTEAGLSPAHVLGLEGFRQEFQMPARSSFIETPPGVEAIEGANLVGIIPGETDDLLLITANYDGMGKDPDSGKIYPGADYNASGVAAVLEIARFLASRAGRPRWTVVVALLDGEECGGFGSSALAELIEDRGLKDRCRAINLEGLGGGQGDYMNLWDQNYKKNRPTVEAILGAAEDLGIEVELGGTDPGTSASVFLLHHIPAVTCEWSWYERKEHEHFHRVTDTLDNMDPENVRKVTTVVALASYRMAWSGSGS